MISSLKPFHLFKYFFYCCYINFDICVFFCMIGPSYVPSPSRLTLFESRVYFTDGTKEGVIGIDKFIGANSSTLLYTNRSETREPRGIKAVHPLLQPQISSPCGENNGGCEHMCVLTEQNNELGFECACHLGYQLLKDGKQCNREFSINDYLSISCNNHRKIIIIIITNNNLCT